MLLQRKNGYAGLPSPFSQSSRCLRCGSGTEFPGLSSKDPRSSARNHHSFAKTALERRNIDAKEISEYVCYSLPKCSEHSRNRGGNRKEPGRPESRQISDTFFLSKEVTDRRPESLELSYLRRPGRESGGKYHSPKLPHSPLRHRHFEDSGISLSIGVEPAEGHSQPTIGRWHSLSRLPSCDSGVLGPMQPSAGRQRSISEQDLRASLPERVQREVELVALLKEASDQRPKGEMKELRKLEVDLNVMKFELQSLKQRMESSFAVLEKEKKWLETMPSGDRKRKGKRKEKIGTLTLELLKAKSYLRRKRDGLLSQEPSQCTELGKEDISQETPTLHRILVAQENCTKALGKEEETTAWKLQSAREEKVALDHPVEKPPLDLECVQKKPKGSGAQVVALQPELVPAKSQVSQEDQEKVLLKRDLESTRQGNKELYSEADTSREKSLEAFSDCPYDWEAEKMTLESCIQALENERAQLLREREERSPKGQLDGPSWEELRALQAACESLRESQSHLQREKDVLKAHCLELEAALQGQQEEMERHLAEQKQISQHWQERWEQVATALKNKEVELEKTRLQSPVSPAQLEPPLLLPSPPDACKQELEGNRSQAKHQHVQHWESGSQTDAVPTSEEVALVREELQDVWDMLKVRDTELEKKQLELESTRSQYEECRSEKQHLDRLLASLEDQLAEKQEALRQLEEAEHEDRAEKEMKITLLEQKLAEMEAAQALQGRGSNGAAETREMQGNMLAEDSRSRETCCHCRAALTRLNQAIQSAIKQQKEDQTLACLYQVQDLLKRSILDRAAVPTPGQSPSPDPSARIIHSPQQEREILRQRHQLVTEQLKGLFRQKHLDQSKKQPGGGKEDQLQEPPKPREVLAGPKFSRPPEDQPAASDVPSSSAEVQSLQQLLKEKTETIFSMASEIQTLQQKNESLMKAKLRFQQQIQQIRNLPKQQPERSTPELLVPRLSASLGQDLQSTHGSDSSIPSPQSDEPPFTSSREDLSQAPQVSQHPTSTEDQRRGSSSDEGTSQMRLTPLSFPVPAAPPTKSLSLELVPTLQVDSEGALLSPRGSALLSPRPFGPPRPWSPFRFRGNPELPDNREKP